MKKRWIACLLAICMLCAAVPAAFGAEEPAQQATETQNTSQGVDLTAAAAQSPVQGVTYVDLSNYEISADTQVLHAELIGNASNKLSGSNKMEDLQPILTTRAEEQAQAETKQISTGSFTTYGEQLSNMGLVLKDGSVVEGLGTVMDQLYRSGRAEIKKGTNSAYFNDNVDVMDSLAVAFQVSGADEQQCLNIQNAMMWLVYICLDYDCPEMFYSNGYCGGRGYVSGDMIALTIRPLYTAGFESLETRQSLAVELDTAVQDVLSQAAQYTRAYDKMKFFHDWLCAKNSYNDAATATNYATTVSGAPFSSISGLLSSSDSTVEGPVCEGYARAFQLLCSRAGITVALMTSKTHMWNNLRYGQYWTGMDVTWDDTGSSYNYFFQCVNGMSGHVLNDDVFQSFTYPELHVISDSSVLPFYDSMADWQRPAVQYMYDNSYMAGMTCVTFDVNNRVTRAQFAVILYNIADRPAVTYSSRFSDVPDGKWYTAACLWLAQQGIAAGYPNGAFGVNDCITREQIVQMLYQREGKPTASADLSQFTDVDQIHSWAMDAMVWAVDTDTMSGQGNGKLAPRANATRAESAVLLKKITERAAG